MGDCASRRASAPRNPDRAWCERYGAHLDDEGRICRRCRADPAFRIGLEALVRRRAARDCDGVASWCERFRIAAGGEVCERCRADPGYRAFLAGQRDARPRLPPGWPDACPHRGEVLRTEMRRCCGDRLREVAVRACALRGEAAPERCAECASLPDAPF